MTWWRRVGGHEQSRKARDAWIRSSGRGEQRKVAVRYPLRKRTRNLVDVRACGDRRRKGQCAAAPFKAVNTMLDNQHFTAQADRANNASTQHSRTSMLQPRDSPSGARRPRAGSPAESLLPPTINKLGGPASSGRAGMLRVTLRPGRMVYRRVIPAVPVTGHGSCARPHAVCVCVRRSSCGARRTIRAR